MAPEILTKKGHGKPVDMYILKFYILGNILLIENILGGP